MRAVVGPGGLFSRQCAVESAFGGKRKDVGDHWALGRGDEIQEVSQRRRRGVPRAEADGGVAHGLCALFARPVSVGVALNEGEEMGVVVEVDNRIREQKRRC